jgi:hypothetical protein
MDSRLRVNNIKKWEYHKKTVVSETSTGIVIKENTGKKQEIQYDRQIFCTARQTNQYQN